MHLRNKGPLISIDPIINYAIPNQPILPIHHMKFKPIIVLAAVSAFAAIFPPASLAKDRAPTFKSADEIVKQISVEGRIAFEQKALPFKFDSTDLANEDAYRQLVEIAKALQSPALKESRFQIDGHTCDLGADAYNLDLSKRRAAAIQALLKKAGVAEDRIKTDGKGEASPAVPNSSEENRAKNRRVEIKKLS
jgi:outer membrane protein OmpA-like peptidoglycan-associated protein